MNTHSYDVAFIDPADDGDRAVLELSGPDRRLVVVLMLTGPAARPLYRRMQESHVSLDAVVEDYVDEIRRHAVERRLTIKEWVRVVGSTDAVGAISQIAGELPGSRILVPDHSEALGPEGLGRLAEQCGSEIVTPRRRQVA